MYFVASLVPESVIIEADNEEDFKEKIKHIPIERFVYHHDRVSKEKIEKELAKRYVFLNI